MPQKIRVGYVIDSLEEPLGGTERQLLETLRRLDKSRFEVWLVCLRGSTYLEKTVLPCKVVILEYEGFFTPQFLSVLKRFRSFVRSEKIDVLQTFFEDSFFVTFFATCGIEKSVVRIASRRDVGMGPHRLWYHRVYDWVRPFFIRRFDGAIVNAPQVADFLRRQDRMPSEKIKIIFNGVEFPESGALPHPEVFDREKADVWIAQVANLKKIKRHDVFLKSLVLVQRAAADLTIKATFMGEGSDRAEIEGLISELGLQQSVFLLGSLSDVKPALMRSHIGVLTSDKEGLSNAILEYMACSLPVVATDVGGNRDLVDPSFGFRVPPGNPEALSEALVRLVKDPALRSRMGENSRKKGEMDFSWSRHMKELEGYYESLCAKK